MRARVTLYLTWSVLKMTFRDRAGIFFAFFLPLVIMLIFGLLNFGELGKLDLGVVDAAQNEASAEFISGLSEIDALNISMDSEAEERAALADGERDLVVILPAGFGDPAHPSAALALIHDNRPEETRIGAAVLRSAVDDLNFRIANTPRPVTLRIQSIAARDRDYADFLMPGIIAMAIMQVGLFSVAFAFVNMKRTGVFRRLRATPLHPRAVIFAFVATRLIIVVVQTLVLAGVTVLLFRVDFSGNILAVLAAATLGGAVFLAMGFALSGWANSEQQAGPLANLVSLPMMFLSGVFFSREVLPDVLQVITDYFPLTFMVEAIRGLAIQGDSLVTQWPNFLGMAVWLVVAFVIATRAFRWE